MGHLDVILRGKYTINSDVLAMYITEMDSPSDDRFRYDTSEIIMTLTYQVIVLPSAVILAQTSQEGMYYYHTPGTVLTFFMLDDNSYSTVY